MTLLVCAGTKPAAISCKPVEKVPHTRGFSVYVAQLPIGWLIQFSPFHQYFWDKICLISCHAPLRQHQALQLGAWEHMLASSGNPGRLLHFLIYKMGSVIVPPPQAGGRISE